jgi:ribosomal protein S18 acetylase RimI-like enzyme
VTIRIETYTPELGEAIERLQRRYIAVQSQGSKFVPKEFYSQHPAMEGGKNIFCAFADDALVGYGALIPTPAEPDSAQDITNTIWIYIRVDPEASDWMATQEALYEAILEKSLKYGREWPGRETRVAISYPEGRQEEIAYFVSKGLERFDALLQMRRDLSEPMPELELPPGVTARRWRMEGKGEKERYLEVERSVWPQSPRTVAELTYFFGSWKEGTAITAFDEAGRIVGSVMAYWYGEWHGVTEDVFVVPDWRRKGIARHLIVEGMKVLWKNGIRTAGLEVRESNQPAVRLYQGLGYRVAHREVQLALSI